MHGRGAKMATPEGAGKRGTSFEVGESKLQCSTPAIPKASDVTPAVLTYHVSPAGSLCKEKEGDVPPLAPCNTVEKEACSSTRAM